MAWSVEQTKLFRKEAVKEWGKGWDMLSQTQQDGALCKKVCGILLQQAPSCRATLAEVQDLIRSVCYPQ